MRPPTPRTLLDDLRNACFAPAGGPTGGAARVGMEAEAIVVDSATRRPFPLEAGLSARASVPALRRLAAARAWLSRSSPKSGVPEIRLPDGGRITFEPGGQIEFSSAPSRSASDVLRSAREVFAAVAAALEPEGAELLFLGIDPLNAVEDTTLQLRGERYVRMDRHFWRSGPDGARMMRQSASVQFALDWGDDRDARWTLLNGLVPYLAAMFANSPFYGGRPSGLRSYRRKVWDTLDPLRTGIRETGDGSADSYLAFALGAPAILVPGGERPCAPFARWLETGCVTMADWHAHLSTLFPEVRPRGYLEVRTIDALAPQWYAAPMALLVGLAYDKQGTRDAIDLLGTPDPRLLEVASREGLANDHLGSVARDLWSIALRGCTRLGPSVILTEDVDIACEFAAQFTAAARAPADDAIGHSNPAFAALTT